MVGGGTHGCADVERKVKRTIWVGGRVAQGACIKKNRILALEAFSFSGSQKMSKAGTTQRAGLAS